MLPVPAFCIPLHSHKVRELRMASQHGALSDSGARVDAAHALVEQKMASTKQKMVTIIPLDLPT